MAEGDTTRTTVKTYVPAYQRAEWQRHADRMDMSRSEFVRTMVQVGRRDFEVPAGGASEGREDPPPDGSDGGFDERVVEALSGDGPLEWEQLLVVMTEDLEDRLDEALVRLQDGGRVQHSGRDGGYRLVDDE